MKIQRGRISVDAEFGTKVIIDRRQNSIVFAKINATILECKRIKASSARA